MPVIFSFPDLYISIGLLFLAFFIQPVTWMTMLKKSNYFIPFNDCIAGHGLSVFGKYIPGKIWTVVGRSAYIEGKVKISLSDLTVLSLRRELYGVIIIAFFLGLFQDFVIQPEAIGLNAFIKVISVYFLSYLNKVKILWSELSKILYILIIYL